MQWSIPQPSCYPLAIEFEAGEQIFVVGANGSGKSALLQHLAASSGEGKIRRIFAHRQTWLRSGSLKFAHESGRQSKCGRNGLETANDNRTTTYLIPRSAINEGMMTNRNLRKNYG